MDCRETLERKYKKAKKAKKGCFWSQKRYATNFNLITL